MECSISNIPSNDLFGPFSGNMKEQITYLKLLDLSHTNHKMMKSCLNVISTFLKSCIVEKNVLCESDVFNEWIVRESF